MAIRTLSSPIRLPFQTELLSLGLAVVAAGFIAVNLLFIGYWSFALYGYVALGILGILNPSRAALITVVLAGAFESGAVDLTGPIGDTFQDVPPTLRTILPITISPFELVLLAIAAGATLRRTTHPPREQLPLAVWAFPAFVALGAVYGLSKGAEQNLVYHEARGLIFGSIAFYITVKVRAEISGATILKVVIGTTMLLAAIVLYRYLFLIRTGAAGVAAEAAFAHEDAILLGLGFVTISIAALVTRGSSTRLVLILLDLVVLAAMISTARRSATLVLLVAVVFMAVLVIRTRPWLVIGLAIPILLLSAAYTAAFWNQEYGALAQPARAVRSQIDPSPRDDSSDRYRDTETFNVLETIRYNKVFGVGFGRPFAAFQPLPDMTSIWPLQWHSPHNNILWLWLKLGIAGAAVALAVWVLAVQRAMTDAWTKRSTLDANFALAVVVGCGLLMYFTFARVDLAFLGSRGAVPLGCLLALAFTNRRVEEAAPSELLVAAARKEPVTGDQA